MKILVIQDRLRSGGTERQSVFLANAIAASGHEATLLTFRPGGPLADTVASGVRRAALQPIDLGWDWFAPGLRRFVAHAAPDVVLCMGRMANCWGYATLPTAPQSASRRRLVCTMRTGKALPRLFRRSLQRCDLVVANSREAADVLAAAYHVPPERISVIYNSLVFRAAVADVSQDATRARYRAQLGAGPNTRVLLCVAMFRPEKRQRELIEIAAGLPSPIDWQLWLAGEGPARKSCEELARAKGLADRVKFLGFQTNPSGLYPAADLAVHASSSESLSNFLIEAQVHGVPAVAYEAQGIRECFVPGKTGWAIRRDDVAGFRERVAAVLEEPSPAKQARSAAAREFAQRNFDPERQVKAYLELFARLASSSRTG